jgi:arsenate reductase
MNASRLLHNPRCSKSRAALALLEARGVDFTVVPYLEQPPSVEELRVLLDQLGIGPRDLLRSGEAEFSALRLDDPALGDDALVVAMAAHPKLIERPVFMHRGRAVIGRPPERVLELLD